MLTIIQGCATAQTRNYVQKHEKLSVSLLNGQPGLNRMQSKTGVSAKSFLGVNNLYSIDDDTAWNQQNLGQKLSQLGIGALRYPGGEVADNYDWETNSQERSNQTSAESSSAKSQRLDYLEFLKNAAQIGVSDIFFVVNVEGAFISPGNRDENILRYAKKAARWVDEVKRHGYKVKYWEIGNEAYLPGTTYPLSAEEYAQALKVFYREMKQVDPSIQIGAIGPDHTGKHGFVDGLTNEQQTYLRQKAEGKSGNTCQRKGKKGKDCVNLITQSSQGKTTETPWWDTVIANAKNSFDFAVIHNYGLDRNLLKESREIQNLRSYLNQNTGRSIDLNITEWNIPPSKRVAINAEDMPLDDAVKLGNYLAAGVSHAIYWPIRYKDDERALLSFENSGITPVYKALVMISPVLQGEFVNQLSLEKDVYFLQTQSNQGMAALLVNRSTEAKLVNATLNAPSTVEINQLNTLTEKNTVMNEKAKQPSNILELQLPPKSITVLTY